jgi:hypothetical protein
MTSGLCADEMEEYSPTAGDGPEDDPWDPNMGAEEGGVAAEELPSSQPLAQQGEVDSKQLQCAPSLRPDILLVHAPWSVLLSVYEALPWSVTVW